MPTVHKYYILRDDITDEEAKELSDSQNAEQNQNVGNGDGQNIRKVLSIYNDLPKKGPHVQLGAVISKYSVLSLAASVRLCPSHSVEAHFFQSHPQSTKLF